jgi:hypothetical protein
MVRLSLPLSARQLISFHSPKDARFFPGDVLRPLFSPTSSSATGMSRQERDRVDGGKVNEVNHKKLGLEELAKDIRLAPPTAIAHQLIKSWVQGEWKEPEDGKGKEGITKGKI